MRIKKKHLFLITCILIAAGIVAAIFLAVKSNRWEEQIDNYKTESIITSEDGVKVSFFYPVFKAKKVNESIDEYINSTIEEYKSEAKGKSFESQCELNCEFETFRNDNYISIRFNYTAIDAEDGSTYKSTETLVFDYRDKKEMYVDNVFKNELEDLNKLALAIVNKIDKENPDSIDKVVALNNILRDREILSEFAIKELGIAFYFEPKKLDEKCDSSLEVTLSFVELRNMLKISVQEYLEKVLSSAAPSEETVATVAPTEQPKKGGKKVAITFDDGPGGDNTRYLLDELKKMDAKVTFMLLGAKVQSYPQLVQQMVADGHELGNHSYSHRSLDGLPKKQIRRQILRTDAAVKKATNGLTTDIVRPPYGAFNKKVLKTVGKPVILWSVDTLDWKYRDAKRLKRLLAKKVKPGDIVLMHDIHSTSVKGAIAGMKELQKKGFTFVTVSELLGDMKPGKVYFEK